MTVVGSIVYATKSGLGNLAKLLFDSKIIDRVFVAQHKTYHNNLEWYPQHSRETNDIKKFLESIDTLFLLEAPLPDVFDWTVAQTAKYMGKKVVLMPMYESTPRANLFLMDEIICPSLLDLEYFSEFKPHFIPVPSSPDVPFRLRKEVRTFVHNVGHGGIFSRNGTVEILEALPLIKSTDFKLIIRIQPDAGPELIGLVDSIEDSRVEVVKDHIPFEDLWAEGDVFLFPEKFNGLSLPLQEAYAAGMLVMAGNRYPIHTWLPHDPLIPVSGYFTTDLPWIGIKVKNAIFTAEAIANTIDKWVGKDIRLFSAGGESWAEYNAGYNLKHLYDELLR